MRLRVLLLSILIITLMTCRSVVQPPLGTQQPTPERLRTRAELALNSFTTADFKGLQALGSARHRREIESLPRKDQIEGRRNFERFVREEKPILEIIDVRVSGLKARVTTRVSVLEPDGTRMPEIVYDHWVFESGDWFLEEMNRVE